MLVRRVIRNLCIVLVFIGCKDVSQQFKVDLKIEQLTIEKLYDKDAFCKIDDPVEMQEISEVLDKAAITSVIFQGDLRLVVNEDTKRELIIISKDNFLKYHGKSYKLPAKSFETIEAYFAKCGE